jgi:hypothetical protein
MRDFHPQSFIHAQRTGSAGAEGTSATPRPLRGPWTRPACSLTGEAAVSAERNTPLTFKGARASPRLLCRRSESVSEGQAGG